MTQRVRWDLWAGVLLLVVVIWALINTYRSADAVSPASVVITEIHHSPTTGDVEFIELLNVDDQSVDLGGFGMSGLITIPGGTMLGAGDTLVLTADITTFETLHPGVSALEWNGGESLDDLGELLVLTSPDGTVVDQVHYGNGVIDPPAAGEFTIGQVIDGTIGAGDGSNPNEDGPMGLHDAPLYLPQGWSWAQGATRNAEWGTFGAGNSLYAEWRCAVIPEFGHNPPVPFRVNVRNAAYWQYANGTWTKGFDVNLTGGHRGSYLGDAGQLNSNPYTQSRGNIGWRVEADGSYSAPWNSAALMMHFWASQRLPALPGQTAELSTAEVRLQQPDGATVDLSQVDVLFQCGVDYYSVTTGQGTQVPGPGIGKYHWGTSEWAPTLWTTLPPGAPAASSNDFASWLLANRPPVVVEPDVDESAPWPVAAAGSGRSLELIDPSFNNAEATAWVASSVDGGTPGATGTPMCNGLAVTVNIAEGDAPTAGADVILGTLGDDVIDGLGGDDTICGLRGDDIINGGNGVDTIFGGDGLDLIGGQGGDDMLYGDGDADQVFGGIGNDTIWGGEGDDDLRGQGDDDELHGEEGVDQLYGGSGNDTIMTGPGGNLGTAQVVRGQGNNDVIVGSSSSDDLDGGPGADMLSGAGGDDRLLGGGAADELFGDDGDDVLEGGPQRDTLHGGLDDDLLRGGSGDDDLFGESGDDELDGQGGVDTCDGGDTGETAGDSATVTCEVSVGVP